MVSAYFLRMLWCLTWKKESNQVLLLLSQKQILGKQNTILLHNFSLIQPFSCIMLRTLRAQQQSCLWFVFFFFFFSLFFHFSVTGTCELFSRTVGSSRMALRWISDTTRTLRSLPQCQFVSFLFHLFLFVGETIHCWCLNSARFLFSSTTKTSIASSRPKVLLSRNIRFVRCPVPPDWNIKIKYQLYLSHAHAGQAVTCKCQ